MPSLPTGRQGTALHRPRKQSDAPLFSQGRRLLPGSGHRGTTTDGGSFVAAAFQAGADDPSCAKAAPALPFRPTMLAFFLASLLRILPFTSLNSVQVLAMLGLAIFTAITSAIIGYHMRREIKKALGRKATDEDLADIETWMEVRDAEQKSAAKKPPHLK